MLDGLTVLYKSNVDLFFYVLGGAHENELLLMSVLNCVYDSISQIMRKNVEKRALFENLDIIMLALDEICDGGIVLESDPQEVVNRVALRTDDIPLGEQTVAQVRDSNRIMACEKCSYIKIIFDLLKNAINNFQCNQNRLRQKLEQN